MEVQGKVIQILPEQTGEGKNGTWRKNLFVIETSGQYPKKVCIEVWGDKFDQFQIAQDQFVTASIDVESREYNGKWYTNVRAWKVEQGAGAPQQPPVNNQPFYEQPQTAPAVATPKAAPQDTSGIPAGNEPPAFDDDLPF